MNRNFEIYRAILQRINDTNTPNCTVRAEDFSEFEFQEVAYHIRMLKEERMIEASIVESPHDDTIQIAIADRMLNRGHDFLDSMRNETLWNKIVKHFEDNSVDMTIALVMKIGNQLMDKMLS